MLKVKDFVDLLTSEEKDMEMVVKDFDDNIFTLKNIDHVRFNYVENQVELTLFAAME